MTAACDHPVFCNETILHSVNVRHRLFNDSKYFVDQVCRVDPVQVLARLDAKTLDDPILLRTALAELFDPPGSDLDWAQLPDYSDNLPSALISSLNNRDQRLAQFASHLHRIWPLLGRRAKSQSAGSQRSTILSTRHSFIVPGGRFNEFYYWDTFWVIKGLLASGMFQTARGMLENFLDLLERFGFIPNGNRIYYLNRSQPPLLTQMLLDYLRVDFNASLLQRALPLLDKEYQFWRDQRMDKSRLNQYWPSTSTAARMQKPRPESFAEDWNLALGKNETEKWLLYTNIVSATESGWDFSSRWIRSSTAENRRRNDLRDLKMSEIIPVDLQSILYRNELTLACLHRVMFCATQSVNFSTFTLTNATLKSCFQKHRCGDFNIFNLAATAENLCSDNTCKNNNDNTDNNMNNDNNNTDNNMNNNNNNMNNNNMNNMNNNQTTTTDPLKQETDHLTLAKYFSQAAAERQRIVDKLLWNPTDCLYHDGSNLPAGTTADDQQYASSIFPIWAGLHRSKSADELVKMLQTLNQTLLGRWPAGMPASTVADSGQQWDFPNGWPPLQWLAVEALLLLRQQSQSMQSFNGEASSTSAAKSLETMSTLMAKSLAQRWFQTNYCSWLQLASTKQRRRRDNPLSTAEFYVRRDPGNSLTGMFEKYDVRWIGLPGDGGEYPVQTGFGWTNGVILDWLQRFADSDESLLAIESNWFDKCPQLIRGNNNNTTNNTNNGSLISSWQRWEPAVSGFLYLTLSILLPIIMRPILFGSNSRKQYTTI